MSKELAYSINRFAWMLHVSGSMGSCAIPNASHEIESAYKSLTDLIFQQILDEPELAKETHELIKKELLKLMEEANEVMTFFKNINMERYSTAGIIQVKLQVIFDFLDDYQEEHKL